MQRYIDSKSGQFNLAKYATETGHPVALLGEAKDIKFSWQTGPKAKSQRATLADIVTATSKWESALSAADRKELTLAQMLHGFAHSIQLSAESPPADEAVTVAPAAMMQAAFTRVKEDIAGAFKGAWKDVPAPIRNGVNNAQSTYVRAVASGIKLSVNASDLALPGATYTPRGKVTALSAHNRGATHAMLLAVDKESAFSLPKQAHRRAPAVPKDGYSLELMRALTSKRGAKRKAEDKAATPVEAPPKEEAAPAPAPRVPEPDALGKVLTEFTDWVDTLDDEQSRAIVGLMLKDFFEGVRGDVVEEEAEAEAVAFPALQ